MNEEKRKILEHLVEYLQDKIDTGYHKIFYNDLMYDEKTVDCINAINEVLKEIERLNNKLKLISKIVEREFPPNEFITCRIKKILKGSDK